MAGKVVEMLFPEVSNLYGDPFNMNFLGQCLEASGCEYSIVRDELCQKPYFADAVPDLVWMGPMTEHSQELVIEALKPYKERLLELIRSNTIFVITGNALEIFGKSIECEDGTIIPALGLFDTVARRKMFERYNSIFLGEFERIKIVGHKSQFSHSYHSGNTDPSMLKYSGMIQVTRGDGLCPGNEFEGIRYKNFLATYLLGPLLVLNPLLTKWIMTKMGVENPKIAFETEAMNAYNIRLTEFTNPATELN